MKFQPECFTMYLSLVKCLFIDLQVAGYSDEEEYPDGEKYSKEQNAATKGFFVHFICQT